MSEYNRIIAVKIHTNLKYLILIYAQFTLNYLKFKIKTRLNNPDSRLRIYSSINYHNDTLKRKTMLPIFISNYNYPLIHCRR